MRELIGHRVNPANDKLNLAVLDEPGAGGANHLYHITGFDSASNPSDPWTKRHGQSATHSTILFQNGPIAEAGVNGITHEVLLEILIDRLRAFQAGPYANPYNATALSHLEDAQSALLERTRERMARNVEGTHTQFDRGREAMKYRRAWQRIKASWQPKVNRRGRRNAARIVALWARLNGE